MPASRRSMNVNRNVDHNGHHPRVLVIDDDDQLADV